MKKIVFTCKSITPMFMYGADGKTPELRPASIKGVMRFWWRAINGHLQLEKLKEQEAEIFGSTKNKSSFSIKIPKYENIPNEFKIEFIKGNNCDFDIKSFFELVVILGLFGQKGKGKQKTQGSIKITKIDNRDNNEIIDLDYIHNRLKKFSKDYKKQKYKIELIKKQELYPIIDNISISKDKIFYINFINSKKIKTIKKDLGKYNAN